MATSARFNSLIARIGQLEVHLLPIIDPTLNYSEKDADLTRAYCLLTHAEIEAYLEDIILDVAKTAFNNWENDKSIISPIIFHLAFTYKPENTKKEVPYSMVVLSYQALEAKIKKNNGIKEDNIKNLLRPIGFDMDATLLHTLSNFGSTRGQIAHTSFQTQQPLDPTSEKATVTQICAALVDFDEQIKEYEQNGTINRVSVNIDWGDLKTLHSIRNRCASSLHYLSEKIRPK